MCSRIGFRQMSRLVDPTLAQRLLAALCCIALMLQAGCATLKKNNLADRLHSSNFREWTPSLAKTPRVTIIDNQAWVRNVRQCSYVSEDDYTVNYFEKQLDVNKLRTVDYIVVPFDGSTLLAHTMLSFGFEDGQYLCVSPEVRTEKGEKYSAILGLARQFEITYVIGDERDLIGLRTKHRNSDVYVYPTSASPEQVHRLFFDVMQRVNDLANNPEFYNSLTNNCTTNLARHVNDLQPSRVPYDLPVLFPALSAQYAYKLGLLDQSLPFAELKKHAKVNSVANAALDSPDFSARIREDMRLALQTTQSAKLR